MNPVRYPRGTPGPDRSCSGNAPASRGLLAVLGLAFRVLRVDRRTRASTILTTVGVAVATGLVLLLISLPYATQARAERANWQLPDFDHEGSALLFAHSEDSVDGTAIQRIDVASTVDPATIRLPTGVPQFPAPGQVLVSPALFERMHELPAAQLADRFPAQVAGTLTDDALAYPGQLVALVGHTPDTMPSSVTSTAGFRAARDAAPDGLLQLLAGVGVVVLLVPSLVLVASSSRLTAARRERRLAALRLAGATPGQVTAMVAAETGIAAAVGALLGLALSPALRALATFVPWDGGTWQATDFQLPAGVTVLLVLAIPALVLAAAVLGLRRVVRNPIGAASAHTPKPLRAWRLLALPVTGVFFYLAVTSKNPSLDFVLLGLLLVVGSAVVVGPWVTYAVGRIFVRCWRRPAGLLAGRRLLDDPRGAYRASAGVVLAVFVGSMALTLMPSLQGMAGEGGGDTLSISASAAKAGPIAAQANARLAAAGQPARASVTGESQVVVHTTGSDVETVRTALAAGGEPVFSRDGYLAGQQSQLDDVRRVTVIGLVAAAVLAGCSAAISTAGSVLDRRRTFGALMAAGTPVRVLSRALRAEAGLPALAATVGAGVVGVLVGLGLFVLVQDSHQDATAVLTPWLLAPVVLGLGVAVLAASVCTPALNRVRAEPLTDD